MPTINDIRAQHPEYGDLSDTELADGLYRKFYSDLPRPEFDAKIGLKASPAALSQPTRPPTLQERADQMLPLDPDVAKRGTILPLGQTKEGKLTWAVPQIAVDMMKSFLLPGHVIEGGSYTPQDALDFTLNFSAPATAHKLPSGARKAMSKAEFVRNAPTTEDLLTEGGKQLEAAKASGVSVKPDSYLNFMDGLEKKMIDEGADPMLHPKANAVMNAFTKRLGNTPTFRDLMIQRRQLGVALASPVDDERRIAKIMQRSLDDFVNNLSPADLATGTGADASAAAAALKDGNRLYSMGKKAGLVEEIVDRATRQASGFENGIRIGMRRLLNDKADLRAFSPDEIKVIEQIEGGMPIRKALRFFGKFGPNRSGSSNVVGTTIGSYIGGQMLGPVGYAAGPAMGSAANFGAEKATLNAVDYLKALVASGGRGPINTGPGRLADAIAAAGLPVVNTQLPKMTQPSADQEKLARLLAGGI